MNDRDTGKPPDPSQRQPPPRSRLEDEVLEILYRTDQPASFTDHVRRKAAQQRQRRVNDATSSIRGLLPAQWTSGSLLIAAFVVAFLAILVRDTSAVLATLLALASVILLIWPIIERFRRPDQSDIKRWRGQDMDFRPPPPPWVQSLQDRFRRPPRR